MALLQLPEHPQEITAAWFDAAYQDLRGSVASAEQADGPAAWLEVVERWNRLKALAQGEGSRRSYAYTKDMRDAAAEEAERVVREEIRPLVEDHDAALGDALLTSRHRDAVAERFGEQLLRVLEVQKGPLAPVNAELRVAASDLASRYDKLVASGEVQVRGEAMTLARARSRFSSSDAATRREAFEAYFGWFLENRSALADLYAQQVRLRDEMGKNLGHASFVPLGYAGMGRTDYGPEQVQAFRDAVRTHAAPLFARKAAAQAAALGVETLKPWDVGYHPELSLPDGAAEPVDEQLDRMDRVLERLSPRLREHFLRMRREALIDLENRKGKAAGAYCTSFPDEGRVAIFCNSTGNEDDVRTLTHELGHAFQGWESQWIEAPDLQWPTSDACEVHSMGMEFLCLPYLDEFFGADERDTFTKGRWSGAIDILCYVCVVDAFQHWVYEHPEASPDERDAAWVGFRETYMPGIDWSGDAERYAASRWYAQLHIYRYPFYYIDYALAETGAMQLGMLDAQDHEGCLERYLELCRLGGTQSVLRLLEGAGLRSPFDPALMQDLMAHAAGILAL